MSHGSAVVDYKNIDSDDPAARVAGFLNYVGPNILHYAPIRRELVQKIFGFQRTQPFSFSFHDQTVSLLYLLNGRFVSLKRFLYLYDLGPWQENETAQQRDVSFYKDAGLDPAINKLHWFICAFEGAALIRNADVFPDYPLAQRQPIADLWFSAMAQRFRNPTRLTYDFKFTNEAGLLHAALQKTTGQMSFHQMLTAISGFMALSSPDHAQRYFEFWNGVINKPQSPGRSVGGGGLAPRPADESRHPRRRARHAHLGGKLSQAQADDRDRRQADPLAHHEDLFDARRQRFRHLLRLQGLRDQGIFRQLLSAHVGRDLRHGGQQRGRSSAEGRALARHPGRHRREHADRRAPQARRAITSRTKRPSASPTATASAIWTSGRPSTFTRTTASSPPSRRCARPAVTAPWCARAMR